jgi:peptide chain release factor 2
MQDELLRAHKLQADVAGAVKKLEIDQLQKQLAELKSQSQKPDFWRDNLNAQAVMKKIASLEERTSPWLKLNSTTSDLVGLMETGDQSLKNELNNQLLELEKQFSELREQLRFSGPYDDRDVILSIRAGAGGTEAQDWTQMLLRMYIRWAEKHRLKVISVDESAGEEAGLKSVTIEIDGSYLYGKLKSEHGVHRLVRQSPFNADHLRQTSFAKVEIMPKIDQPDDIQIDEKDLKIDVFRSGGHGGQSVNTTDSAVRLTHLPTGIVVTIQNERSQLQNKDTAMTILRSRLAQLQLEQHAEKISEIKGPNEQAAWGNQIRSYVLHPYKQVKDLRTQFETTDPDSVLDGNLDPFINAYLDHILS